MNNKHYPMKSDVIETDKRFIVRVEMAGCKKEDIDMFIENDTLSLSCKFKQEAEEGSKFIHRERWSGNCQRVFQVGDVVDKDHISAKYENGILTIVLPKIDKKVLEKKNRISIL